jgi:hypothetical protein
LIRNETKTSAKCDMKGREEEEEIEIEMIWTEYL